MRPRLSLISVFMNEGEWALGSDVELGRGLQKISMTDAAQ